MKKPKPVLAPCAGTFKLHVLASACCLLMANAETIAQTASNSAAKPATTLEAVTFTANPLGTS